LRANPSANPWFKIIDFQNPFFSQSHLPFSLYHSGNRGKADNAKELPSDDEGENPDDAENRPNGVKRTKAKRVCFHINDTQHYVLNAYVLLLKLGKRIEGL